MASQPSTQRARTAKENCLLPEKPSASILRDRWGSHRKVLQDVQALRIPELNEWRLTSELSTWEEQVVRRKLKLPTLTLLFPMMDIPTKFRTCALVWTSTEQIAYGRDLGATQFQACTLAERDAKATNKNLCRLSHQGSVLPSCFPHLALQSSAFEFAPLWIPSKRNFAHQEAAKNIRGLVRL